MWTLKRTLAYCQLFSFLIVDPRSRELNCLQCRWSEGPSAKPRRPLSPNFNYDSHLAMDKVKLVNNEFTSPSTDFTSLLPKTREFKVNNFSKMLCVHEWSFCSLLFGYSIAP